MDAAAQLLTIEKLKQLKSRYFRFLDTKDWAGLATIFCDDATIDARASFSIDGMGDGGRAAESNDWIYHGGDAIVDFIKGAAGSSRTPSRPLPRNRGPFVRRSTRRGRHGRLDMGRYQRDADSPWLRPLS